MKILVTGAKGQLGSEIHFLSKLSSHNFEFIDKDELDLSESNSIFPFLKNSNPDYIINCAAYTAVDKAEDEPELAYAINAVVPKKIAEYCKEHKSRLIHISTDYVFEGNFKEPINEKEKPNPKSVYGDTKWEGEKTITKILSDYYIIRTAWVYSSFGNNFVNTMLKLGAEKDKINVVADQYGSPTYARDLAELILIIIGEVEAGNDRPGVYHFSNEGEISWYDFAKEIMRIQKLNCQVMPINTNQFPTKAKRPQYSVLDKSKIITFLGLKINSWNLSLMKYLLNEKG